MKRPSNRQPDELRPIKFTRRYIQQAEGSVLVEFGGTRVICTASVEDRVPYFLRNSKRGWLTAEYSMLPRSTGERNVREATRGKQSGRTQEIQRLIGRSIRAALDLKKIGERTITIDCDVIQADGGTRSASITGAYIALVDAVTWMKEKKLIKIDPIERAIASVSVGVYQDVVITDLDYPEDSQAETDMNVIMDDQGKFIEIQGTAEGSPFSRQVMDNMLNQAAVACSQLFILQKLALAHS